MPLNTLLSNAIISKGQSGTFFRATLALGLLSIALMAIIWPWGIRAMVAAYVSLNVAWTFVWHWLVRRATGYRLRHFLADTMPFAIAATAVMTVTGLVTAPISSLWLLLAARVVLAVVLYYAVMRVAKVKILDECVSFILKRKPSGKD